jgi:hypothetical protein
LLLSTRRGVGSRRVFFLFQRWCVHNLGAGQMLSHIRLTECVWFDIDFIFCLHSGLLVSEIMFKDETKHEAHHCQE